MQLKLQRVPNIRKLLKAMPKPLLALRNRKQLKATPKPLLALLNRKPPKATPKPLLALRNRKPPKATPKTRLLRRSNILMPTARMPISLAASAAYIERTAIAVLSFLGGKMKQKVRLGLCSLGLMLLLAACCEKVSTESKPTAKVNKTFKFVYSPPKNPDLKPYFELLQQRKAQEGMEPILALVNWPDGMTLETKECGQANAFYWPGKSLIVTCYEMYKDMRDKAEAQMQHRSAEYRRRVTIGGMKFLFLHELGHGFFDIFKVPIIGNPEDAADAFAIYALLKSKNPEVHWILQGAKFFFMKNHADFGSTKDLQFGAFADAHPLHQQRYFNMLCFAYGSDPKHYGFLVEKGYLPEGRAKSCPQDWRRLDESMKQLVTPHLDQTELKKRQAMLSAKQDPEAYDASSIDALKREGESTKK
ncbi:DUF4344 domain-containing metallopeptidase [Chitinolyticbacter meiyuanensis]|uniref:DUF4344 domain-containing metallopeptidase n=1 Tax=Chitinolyticbacter meiyuanensis TaxID=682798 RepID=UPI0011E5D654|nr:DUF4344 domain-containing metallopeptidase [Chitinolyticbacter meiyuanensis]